MVTHDALSAPEKERAAQLLRKLRARHHGVGFRSRVQAAGRTRGKAGTAQVRRVPSFQRAKQQQAQARSAGTRLPQMPQGLARKQGGPMSVANGGKNETPHNHARGYALLRNPEGD